MITLLITGVGGPLGQALIKAARLSRVPCGLVATDRSPLSIGLGWVERAHVIADSAQAERYLADMQRICGAERATLVLPGSESELLLLSEHAEMLRATTGAMVVASPPEVLRIGLDKCATSRFLEAQRLSFPRTSEIGGNGAVEELVEALGFPLIAKPVRGSGSRGLFKVRSWDDIRYLRTLGTQMVVQEYLQPDEEEYTVAVYTQRDGRQAGSICFKRELCAGNTYRAWVDQNAAVLAEAEAVVRALQPRGPCNVQLRLTARGAVAFEINPRFSGTTAMRAHFGYNEVEMAIRDFALGEAVPAPVVRPGIALRFWDEVYLPFDEKPDPTESQTAPRLRVLRPEQTKEWMAVLNRSARHDFYFFPGYHALAEERGEGEARLFVFEHGAYMLALPLLLRPLGDLPEVGDTQKNRRDASSVYGYAGPLASHEAVPADVVGAFHRALAEALRELQVVSVFSRLHPLLSQRELLADLGECRPAGQTVSIDLTLTPDAQRGQYRSTAKSRINRLRRDGATCALDAEKRHLRDFISIYHETMRRVGAQEVYFFDERYFRALAESLGDALRLFVVKNANGDVIAGGLFVLCDGIVQYHLGGTSDAALQRSPMPLLMDTVRLWANEKGARVFHLGGGVGANADSLFQFKAGFSDRRHDFATWRWILAPDVYRALHEERQRFNAVRELESISSDFFPAYRCPARPPLAEPIAAHRG